MEVNEIYVEPEYTEAEVAALTGFAPQTLRVYRCRRKGIPFIKREGRITYRQSDVHAYLLGTRVPVDTSTALATEESSIEAPLKNSEMGTLSYGAAD